ncbi:hypothetical protein M427DRAFT_343816 [Gonapodya prolifera JEL478]|uniref:Uncharacterized protein n=1 Tax=Gonapodya prolifera (strain JEL478) TaxID=1344416 RepID=A0A139AVH6_GONPJ|nr:hypothetical protein M427DRAFT_343816 [Gonapodya prolifera JEL478]|eukprot:KXS20736.1 hypothetical protein M427DRAFT_343816 [Gonapodya prolifera JEL478]
MNAISRARLASLAHNDHFILACYIDLDLCNGFRLLNRPTFGRTRGRNYIHLSLPFLWPSVLQRQRDDFERLLARSYSSWFKKDQSTSSAASTSPRVQPVPQATRDEGHGGNAQPEKNDNSDDHITSKKSKRVKRLRVSDTEDSDTEAVSKESSRDAQKENLDTNEMRSSDQKNTKQKPGKIAKMRHQCC